jgi:hypothetical protein
MGPKKCTRFNGVNYVYPKKYAESLTQLMLG